MSRTRIARGSLVFVGLCALVGTATNALGQVIPPAPPAPPPSREFTPPPPPVEAAPIPKQEKVPPPEEPITPPDLIKRDANGAVILLEIPQDQAAVEAVGIADDKKALYDSVKAERSALYQRFLAQNIEAALRVRAGLAKFSSGDTSSALDLLTIAKRIQVMPSYNKCVELAGVLDARHAQAAARGADAYTAAISRDLKKQVESKDLSVQMQLITASNVRRISVEAMREFDALLARAGEQWATLSDGSTLSPTDVAKFTEAQDAIAKATDTGARANAVAAALALLPTPRAQELLGKAAPALPEKRVLPDLNSALPKDGPRPAARPGAKPVK